MHDTTFIIGGCRSGKSSHALKSAEPAAGRRNLFVATCQPHDEEMQDRIRRHQKERGDLWKTVEAPIDIVDVVQHEGANASIMLIDCLTLWVANLMMAHDENGPIIEKIEKLKAVINTPPCPIILVSNEVGAGIVPENAMARRFRDLTGWCNQAVADGCGEVIWMVAGIPVHIKSKK